MHVTLNRVTNLALRRIPEGHLAGARNLLAPRPYLSPTVYGFGGRQGAGTRCKVGLKGHVGCAFDLAAASAGNVRQYSAFVPRN